MRRLDLWRPPLVLRFFACSRSSRVLRLLKLRADPVCPSRRIRVSIPASGGTMCAYISCLGAWPVNTLTSRGECCARPGLPQCGAYCHSALPPQDVRRFRQSSAV